MSVLMHATHQWSSRPADERFSSLQAMHAAALAYRNGADAVEMPYKSLRVVNDNGEISLAPEGTVTRARFSNWAFGQIASVAEAPASYLRTLPAPLAVDCLNNGLARIGDDDKAQILLHRNGGTMVRALNSDRYTRIWNSDITSRLVELEAGGTWKPAPEAFDGSRGLYLGDRDMFAFLVDNERRIFEKLPGGGLGRGFFAWNSEVGAKTFGVTSFLYEYVCGNHRVWGAKDVKEIRIRHVGNADERCFSELTAELVKYADGSAADDEARIEAARKFRLGADKDAVLDKVFGLRIPGLTKKVIGESFEKARDHDEWYGDPRTVWGLAGGVTEIARDLPYAGDRVELERAAGKLMAIAA